MDHLQGPVRNEGRELVEAQSSAYLLMKVFPLTAHDETHARRILRAAPLIL